MEFSLFIKRIKKYALLSFLVPLITLNACLIFYINLGKVHSFPDLDYTNPENILIENASHLATFDLPMNKDEDLKETVKKKILIPFKKFDDSKIVLNKTFLNCPTHIYELGYLTNDGKTYDELFKYTPQFKILEKTNKIKFLTLNPTKGLQPKCVKNHKYLYPLFLKFSFVEKIFFIAEKNNRAGFVNVKNPYFYGEVSISRTARFYPLTLIFKPLIVLSSIFLFFFWRNTFNLFNIFQKKKIINKFSKKFFYLGSLACIFLILHAVFLGFEFDTKLLNRLRRLFILFFIIFEVSAQIILTINLIKLKKEIKNFINPLFVQIKIIFISVIFLFTIITLAALFFISSDTSLKHVVEWNYFSFLLVYYLLSNLLWKKP
jgi:hypothetical protein